MTLIKFLKKMPFHMIGGFTAGFSFPIGTQQWFPFRIWLLLVGICLASVNMYLKFSKKYRDV